MWDKRYRPLCFSDVLGQEGAVQVLKARLSKGTALDASYIFSGGHGRGKTTLARILGRALLCQELTSDFEPCNKCESCLSILADQSTSLSEMDAASNGTVEVARGIVDKLIYVVAGGKKRVYIFDEVHRMSTAAQDVLLKPLEESKMIGIFCTTEPEKIRGAIRSRCEEFPIRKVTREDILKWVKRILEQEGVEHEDDAVLTVIDHSGGHVRDILNKLEMIAQLGPVRLDVVREYLNLSVVSLYYQILESLADPVRAVALVEAACDRVSPEEVSEGIAEAAMNTYRMAHNMFAEFSYVDRELAAKVHSIYGDSVIKLAEYFLRMPRVSRVSLLGDVIACHSGVPARTEPQAVVLQVPVMVQAQSAATPTVPAPTAPVVSAPPSAPVAAGKPSAAKAPESVKPPAMNGRRSDGVGDRGSSDDPLALTSLDTKAVPVGNARGRDLPKPIVSGPKEGFLTPEVWRRKFLLLRAALVGA